MNRELNLNELKEVVGGNINIDELFYIPENPAPNPYFRKTTEPRSIYYTGFKQVADLGKEYN